MNFIQKLSEIGIMRTFKYISLHIPTNHRIEKEEKFVDEKEFIAKIQYYCSLSCHTVFYPVNNKF